MQILPLGDPTTWNFNTVGELISNLVRLGLMLASAVAVLFIIIGAFHYITAFGNEEKAATAKKTITWAVVGMVVIMLSWLIISEVWGLVSSEKPALPDGSTSTSPPAQTPGINAPTPPPPPKPNTGIQPPTF